MHGHKFFCNVAFDSIEIVVLIVDLSALSYPI